MTNMFRSIALWAAHATGSARAFALAVGLIIIWLISGPIFHWSDTWQLIINTGTTIITFLLVFIIQHTQNRDTVAMHAKLDELIRSNRRADNKKIGIEKE